jgi:hypothetical protein
MPIDGFQDGPAAGAMFRYILGLALAPGGALVAGDAYNHRLRLITSSSGDVSFIDTASTMIECPAGLTSIAGDLNISQNGSALDILCLDVIAVGGDLTVIGNVAATTIDLGAVQHVDGNLTVIDNPETTTIDLGSVETVGGNLTVINNGDATVALGPVQAVGGNLTVQSQGTGTFAADACVQGSSDIDLAGYASLDAQTAMGGTTITMEDGSILRLELQPGTFPTCVAFTIAHVLETVETGTDAENNTATIDAVVTYQFTFAVPTLGMPAELTFDIVLSTLNATRQAEVLDAFANGNITLVTKGDNLGATYSAFRICTEGETPTANGCVVLEALDADGSPTASTPAIIRFAGVVGHFSTWGVAIVTPAPIFNGLLQPYPAPPHAATPTFKRGSVIPLKFNWLDAAGTVLDSASASPALSVYAGSCAGESAPGEPIAVDDAGGSDGWRYDAAARTWIFGWSTKAVPAGCYWIEVTSGTAAYPGPGSLFPLALRDK